MAWFNEAYNEVYRSAQSENVGFPGWDLKYEGCYYNYPDIQIGVNPGHRSDPGPNAGDSFDVIYFGNAISQRLRQIKMDTDPGNLFSFAQSIPLPSGG